jgi:hypothetical protein
MLFGQIFTMRNIISHIEKKYCSAAQPYFILNLLNTVMRNFDEAGWDGDRAQQGKHPSRTNFPATEKRPRGRGAPA